MSTAYYQQRWEEAICDLLGCVQQQNLPLEQNKNQKGITYKRNDLQWFQYYGQLYVRYLQVYRKLEDSYDQMVHPQKRIIMRDMLQNVIVRMLEVKQNLIRYSTQTNIIQSDFINIDEILNEMKLTPKALRVPIPKYFRDQRSERDQIIKQIVEDLKIPEEIQLFNDDITLEANFETLIRIIQKLERGRQGIVRGQQIMKLRNKPHKQRSNEVQNQNQQQIITIQKYWRAFVSRRQLNKMRQQELKFLGIQKQKANKTLLQKAQQQREKLKLIQQDRAKRFQAEKINVRTDIKKNQQKIIKAKMQEQRRKWINKFLQMHQFSNLPNSLNQFYQQKQNMNKLQQPKPKQQKKKDKEKQGKDEGKGKSKKNEVQKFLDQHQSIGPSQAVVNLQKTIQSYSTTWGSRDCSEVDEQFYDNQLAKNQIRPEVEAILQQEVDALISLQLDCMRVKYGIKKKKQKKPKKKKKKEKKVKIPQGLGKKDPKQLLTELFENNIAKNLCEANMSDFIGVHNNLNYLLQKTAEIQPDPSLPQVQNIVTQYIGIPLGSQEAKQKLQKWNWFLFYGPMGTGKTLITRALQKQTKAVLFDITPNNVKGNYLQKSQLTRLIWSVIICAKHFQPAIILIQDFETIFPSGGKGKKKSSDANANFGPKLKKSILDMKKNKLWAKNDRIAVLGCSNRPYDASLKQMKKIFDKKIYFPYPNYPTRKLMLQNFIEKKVGKSLPNFSYNTLAHTTEGFSANSYLKCIDKVLTQGRITRLKDQPLKVSQFIVPLSNTVCVFSDEYQKFKKFTDEVTGMKDRRQAKNSKKDEDKKQAKKDQKKKK